VGQGEIDEDIIDLFFILKLKSPALFAVDSNFVRCHLTAGGAGMEEARSVIADMGLEGHIC